MQTRTWNRGSALLALSLLAGCAGGEDGGLGDDPVLGTFVREAPVQGNLYIEFIDARGEPLQPDAVELSVDGLDGVQVECMAKEEGLCTTWIGDFAALERVTAWATSCGHRFGAALALGPEVDEDVPFEASVSIVGVSGLCGTDEPIP